MPSTGSIILDERYMLVERIGVGGFSEVWRGRDRVLDRPVAVKLLHSGFAGHEETLHRFRAEARHAGALSHQNIARVYDYGDPSLEHPPYLVMELIDGDSLAHMLRAGGAMDAERVMDIIAQAAAGLQAAHEAGLVHRDIKPANLLVSAAGVVRITDFGISYAAGSAPMTRTGMIIGTPAYLAPERASGAQATPASDLYALGVVAYECLTGKPPFAGTAIEVALAHRERQFPPLPASVPGAVAGLVGSLTAKDPASRPRTAADVAATASHLRDQLTTGHHKPTAAIAAPQRPSASGQEAPVATELLPAQPPARRLPRRRVMLALAGGALAAALIVLAGTELVGAAFAHHASGAPPKAAPVTATRVDVNGQALVGLPVGVAVRQLRQQHLRVRVRWEVTPGQKRGRVVAVEPTGRVLAGSLITVTGSQRPPGGHDHGKGHDHGHGKGDGGGDGGDNGGGDSAGVQGN